MTSNGLCVLKINFVFIIETLKGCLKDFSFRINIQSPNPSILCTSIQMYIYLKTSQGSHKTALFYRNQEYLPFTMKKLEIPIVFLNPIGIKIKWFVPFTGLCSSRARWPLAPNFCSWVTRKSYFLHTNHMLGTLDFTVSEHWAPFNFPA